MNDSNNQNPFSIRLGKLKPRLQLISKEKGIATTQLVLMALKEFCDNHEKINMKNISVVTKQLTQDGYWNCSVTFKGYDHLEVADTIEDAQSKMSQLLYRLGFEGSIKFEEPRHYISKASETKYSGISLPRLDTGMV